MQNLGKIVFVVIHIKTVPTQTNNLQTKMIAFVWRAEIEHFSVHFSIRVYYDKLYQNSFYCFIKPPIVHKINNKHLKCF